MTGSAPDYVEPVEGWRVWATVEGPDGVLRLRSLFYNVVWEHGTPVHAACFHRRIRLFGRRKRQRHDPPVERCRCGVHAAFEPVTLLPYLEATRAVDGGRRRVFGRVALWGDVVECEAGWRAQSAYPTHLYVPPEPLSGRGWRRHDVEFRLSELLLYGVPLERASLDERGVHLLESAA